MAPVALSSPVPMGNVSTKYAFAFSGGKLHAPRNSRPIEYRPASELVSTLISLSDVSNGKPYFPNDHFLAVCTVACHNYESWVARTGITCLILGSQWSRKTSSATRGKSLVLYCVGRATAPLASIAINSVEPRRSMRLLSRSGPNCTHWSLC